MRYLKIIVYLFIALAMGGCVYDFTPDSKDLQKLMAMVCAEAGIEVPEVTGTVTVIPRSGENRQGLILMETACAPASYRLPEPMTDLLTGTTYAGTVELKPYDLMILEPNI